MEKELSWAPIETETICFKDPAAMIRKIYDNLQPGGWAEYQSTRWQTRAHISGYLPVSGNRRWSNRCRCRERGAHTDQPIQLARTHASGRPGAANLGRNVDVAPRLKDWMVEAGFVDVTAHQILGPVNAWSSDPVDHQIGLFITQDVIEVVQSSSKFYKAYGMTDEEISKFVEGCCRH
ncbi:S-adenosyl-L-methionine-dependent methyltransferase, partial [Apiospora phragmitis]